MKTIKWQKFKAKVTLTLTLIMLVSIGICFLSACAGKGDNQPPVSSGQTSKPTVTVEDSQSKLSEETNTALTVSSVRTETVQTSTKRTELSSEEATTESSSQTAGTSKVSDTSAVPVESTTRKTTAKKTETSTASDKVHVDLSVNCINAVNANVFSAAGYAPDGIILAGKKITVDPGSTVMDVLWNSGLKINAGNSFLGAYVSAIQGISQGAASGGKGGWIFSINGDFPNLSASNVAVKNGDVVFFHYTVNPGDVYESPY